MTITGEGGIQSSHAITPSARLFRPGAANFIDPVHSPEGHAIGVTSHAAANVVKDGNSLSSLFYKVTNGVADMSKPVRLTVEEANSKIIGYPEFWEDNGKPKQRQVRANVNGQIENIDAKKVEYLIPSGAAMFDHTGNAALFLAHTHPNRGLMAGKHMTQALPLVERETPLVNLKDNKGRNVLEALARTFTIRSKVAGTVEEVTGDHITIAGVKHDLFNNYPMQAKVALHHYPIVKVGDKVSKGQLIADSNYSKDGNLALGVNLRSAYLPWKNASNFEDAIVISESAAKRLASEHLHRQTLQLNTDTKVDKKLFLAQFPTAMDAQNFASLDADGVIKKGAKIKQGAVLVAAVRDRKFEERDVSYRNLGMIHKKLERPYINASLVWDEIFEGEVVRVVKTKDKIEVHIKTVEPVQVADKLSMSSAAKGTVSEIVPDDKMPQDEKGRPIEVIFNPIGVAGRMNPSQTIEQAVGKLVKDGGESYDLTNFDGKDHAAEVLKRLKAKGLSHREKLFDPESGAHIEEPVATGYNYVVKLDHPVRKKFSARTRDSYTMDEAPTQGKGKGAQAYDQLTTYALLGHNAHAILGESFGIRGTKNDDYWLAYQAGETPPPPKVPFVFDKFRTYLNAAGVDTKQHGNLLHFLPMTDRKVTELSSGEITVPNVIRAKDLAEERGGLFDPKVTGGLFGERWAHIDLKRRLPHPLYSKVIRDLTELKQADFYGLIGHTRYLDKKTGKFYGEPGPGRVTGEEAFDFLLQFDVDDKLSEVKRRLQTATGSDRNRLHRASRYLRGLKATGMKANEAYLTSKVPVLPPKYRGVSEMRGGALRVNDANHLYRHVLMARDVLEKSEKTGDLPNDELAKARVALFDSYSALVGVGKPLVDRPGGELQGFVQVIKGKSNKEGLFQRQLARRRNDYTGRSTIEPDANLGVDEIGIPEEMAWKIYQPMVVRRLVLAGWKPADAMREVEKRTQVARGALDDEMKHRPVLYNRAPSLHRWSVAAAVPHITSGKEIKISPAVVGPYGADFDGDTMAVHVPVTDEARRESYKMLPSKNLFYDRDRSLAYGLEKDVVSGIFALTRPGRPAGQKFKTPEDAIAAFRANKGGLRMDSLVRIDKRPLPVAVGWLIFEKLFIGLGMERFLKGVAPPIDGKKLEKILNRVAKESPGEYNRIVREIATAGFHAAARSGATSTSVEELMIDRSKINRLLETLDKKIQKGKTLDEKRQIASEVYEKEIKPQLTKEVVEHLETLDLGYAALMASKATGKLKREDPDPLRQMLASPTLVQDVNDRVVPQVVKSSYGSGMTASDYVLTTPGARAGLVARSLSTALPGFLAKQIAGNMGPVRISMEDCQTQVGIDMDITDSSNDVDVLDRHLLNDIPGTPYKRNDTVTPEMLSRLRDKKRKTLKVRSPMTCKAPNPPCQMCTGRAPDGQLHAVGANIGLNYGQAVSERSTQLTMKSFHSGGTVGSGDSLTAGFTRLRELLSAPDIVRDQGTLAEVSGTVSNIRIAPQGGYYVNIRPNRGGDPVEHYVASGRRLKVKLGDRVTDGDPISDGNYRPQDIAAKKGTLAAQQYVVDEARKAYSAAGATVRKPVLEVLAAGTMRYMEITDDGGEPDIAPGDVIHENDFEARKQRNPRIKAKPTVPGIAKKPLLTSDDLLERLNFQRIEDTLREVPAAGGKSDITGPASPIPGLAYGAKFRPAETGFDVQDPATAIFRPR